MKITVLLLLFSFLLYRSAAIQFGFTAQAWKCTDDAGHQGWKYDPDDRTLRVQGIRKPFYSKCLEVYDKREGSLVQLGICLKTDDKDKDKQRWSFSEQGHIINVNVKKCLQANPQTNLVTINECSEKEQYQLWKLDESTGVITNNGLCLDIGSSFTCQDDIVKNNKYCNYNLPIDERVADLVSKMTMEEKIRQLITNGASIPRLAVPSYQYWSEALHGVAFDDDDISTGFPQVIGLGASFNMDIVSRMAHIISNEARAIHNAAQNVGLSFFSPNINIFRDARWGRGDETPGEDPYLNSRYTVAFVRGLQEGEDPRYVKVAATCKHFAAYSLENSEGVDRFHFDAKVDEQDLAETYLPAFEACVREARVKSIMCAYNSINGVPACANDVLLNQIVRGSWGFDGFVVGDCGAIDAVHYSHQYTNTTWETCNVAMKGGCDLDCGNYYLLHMQEALEHKTISEDDIDNSLHRLFKIRFELGMFDPKEQVPYQKIGAEAIDTPQARQLALQAARESIVLLKNDKNILPLKQGIKVAVIGPLANDSISLLGSYAGIPPFIVTPWQEMKTRLGSNAVFSAGLPSVMSTDRSGFKDAQEAARNSDVALVFVGINQEVETEGKDRVNITLPGIQDDLVQTIHATGTPTVVVLISGGPLAIEWIKDNVPSIVQAWYGGQSAGTAIADILFGDYNPSGKLPVTFPKKDYIKLINMTDMRMRVFPGRTYRYMTVEPLFEFGYGLSYTQFKSEWSTKPETTVNSNQGVSFKVVVTNVGDRAGDEVVQAYIASPSETEELSDGTTVLTSPIKQLFGFKKIHLEPKQSQAVYFTLSPEAMAKVDKHGRKVPRTGKFSIVVSPGPISIEMVVKP